MNKSIVTNTACVAVVALGFLLNNDIVKTVGLFAVSGALTNWIAIHMLFEKVPGFYGSGVIPQRFEEFKGGIRSLVMDQFFSEENLARYVSQRQTTNAIDLAPAIKKVDLSPTFDALIEVIQASSFGQMLGMIGGVGALEPMRQPFIDKMSASLIKITREPTFSEVLQEELAHNVMGDDMHENVSQIVQQRLDELSPVMVKDIIQTMIKKHLGWLVVWGGVFGGLIGLLAGVLNA